MDTIDRTEEHVAYYDERYRGSTLNEATGEWVDEYSDPYPVMCRSWHGGHQVLCDPCEAEAEQRYPQGWRYYPGDVCKHGTYTGGCGIDWMCGPCEMGE